MPLERFIICILPNASQGSIAVLAVLQEYNNKANVHVNQKKGFAIPIYSTSRSWQLIILINSVNL